MAARFLEASVRYLGPCKGKPVFYGKSGHLDNMPLEERRVRIEDMRQGRGISLEREGFELVAHESATQDFFDAGELQSTYWPECEELLRELTGAGKVVFVTHVIRRSERSPRFRQDQTTVPGRFVHCDFSVNPAGSSFWVRKVLPEEEARERMRGRFAIYNVWRVLSDPPQDAPLAICDAGSVDPCDAVATDCIAQRSQDANLDSELTLYRYSPHHRWCYFPDMTRKEALVFKGFDSDPGRIGGVPHVAFTDPGCPPDAGARESIDARFVAFFDD